MPEFQLSPPDQPLPDNMGQNPVATAFSDSPIKLEQSPDVPFDNRETITSAELPDKVCTQCLEDNLVRSGVIETFVKCQKCGEEFCQHGVSKLDPQYCIHCCNDFKIVDVIEQEQRPIFNKDGGLIAVRQFKVRHITLSGLHWLFFNRAISNLTDIELEHAIEYHMSIYHGMIYEREARRVKKSQRNRGKHASNEAAPLDGSVSNPFIVNQDGVQFTTVAQQARKKVRTRTVKVSQSSTGGANASSIGSKAQSPEVIAGLIKTLLAAGFSADQIVTMTGKK